MAYLDENGLEHFWGKIKDHVDSAVAPKADDADVVHKTGDELIQGVKTIQNTSPAAAAGTTVTSLYVRNPEVDRGVPVDGGTSYTQFLFLDRAGEPETTQAGRLAMFQAVSPKAGGTEEVSMTCYKYSSDPSDARKFADLSVGFDKDRIPYATSPATSDDRTNSTDIVTRGYMEASEWNWQKTKKDALVQFKPVPESDLEPVVDFMFTETPPASGDKSPSNPSTIAGVSSVGVGISGKNLFGQFPSSFTVGGVAVTVDSNGVFTLNGTCNVSAVGQRQYVVRNSVLQNFYMPEGTFVALSMQDISGTSTKTASAAFSVRAQIETKPKTGSFGYNNVDADNLIATPSVYNRSINGVMLIVSEGSSFTDYKFKIQLEIGKIKTAFEKYSGNEYTISLGDTYYGGSLDVATGVMTVTWVGGLVPVKGFGYHQDGIVGFQWNLNGNPRFTGGPNTDTDITCTHFINSTDVSQYPENIRLSGPVDGSAWGGYISINESRIGGSGLTNEQYLTNMQQYITNNNVMFAAKVYAPFTVQLTPTQIRSLPALDKYEPRINTVYTDQEAVQVGYQRFANYVDLTTDQTVAGYKTFRNAITMRCSTDLSPIVVVPADSINDGTKRYRYIDAVVVKVADGISNNRLGVLRGYDINSGGNRQFGLVVYNTGNTSLASLIVGALNISGSNPIPYAIAPSTPQYDQNGNDRTNGTDIVTRDWIPKDTRIVHTTGDETIGGEKTFTNNLTVTKSVPIVDLKNTVTSSSYCDIRLSASGNNVTTTIRDNYQGNFTIGHTYQGGAWGYGASLDFYYVTGNFTISACAGSSGTRKSLGGSPDGTLAWNGQTIQTTSDERLKTPLSEVPDVVLDAWEDVNWGQFQYLDAVKEKGESARLHLGLIAQHVMSVFEKHGLDACAYGILCHEEHEAAEDSEAVDLWMVRYAEAQAMEACCARRENARLKKRIADLEERLAALELKIS